MMQRLLLSALLGAWAATAAAQVYRWTDEHGAVHFSDKPPPAGAKGVQKKNIAISSSSAAAVQPYSLQQPMKDFPVTLYSAPGCEPCAPARDLLNARGIPFKETSVRTSEQIAELDRAGGGNAVPVLLVGPTVIKGFQEDQYQRALDIAGYPKPGALPRRAQAEPHPPETKGAESGKPAKEEK